MPHTYALLLILVAFACVMTYIIPAGIYDRENVDGRKQVVNDSYHHVAQQPVSPIEIFRAVPTGLVEAGEIVFCIFLVGDAFGIIHRTGAIKVSVFLGDECENLRNGSRRVRNVPQKGSAGRYALETEARE